MFRQWYKHLREEASGTGDGGAPLSMLGGDPAPTPPTPPATPPAGDPPATPPVNDWRASLPTELKDNAALKKFTSVEALAGSYVNAQKLIGGDKIAVPTKHSTPEDWQNVYRKLGVPEKLDDYAIKFKDGVTIDKDFSEQFRTTSHKLGILPAQAQALAEWFSDINTGSEAKVQEIIKQQYNEGVNTLKQEWGNAFELNINRANKLVKEVAGPEIGKHFIDRGYGGDPQFMRFLAKTAEVLYKEHKFVDGDGGGNPLTPTEIDAEIKKGMMDAAYMDAKHPNHKAAVKHVQDLYAKRYPSTVDKK